MPISKGLDHLVERAALRWEIERRAALREGIPLARRRQRPMIVISRQPGAFGTGLAKQVAQRLGFDLYDRELVDCIAQTAHTRAALVETLDEHVQDRISNWIISMFSPEHLADGEYLRALMQVVIALGQHGRGVIVGRGAHFILDPAYTLRVRAFAPLDVRVRHMAELFRQSVVEAQARVAQLEQERRAFGRHFFRKDPADPDHYDLLVNTGSLPLDACADTVVLAFQARFEEVRPRA